MEKFIEKIYVLYNPIAGTLTKQDAEKIAAGAFADAEIEMQDTTKIGDLKKYVSEKHGAKILILGGDGTLNKFINATSGLNLKNIWYRAAGSGNDFARDIGAADGKVVCIDKYLKNLPTVTAKGKTYKFLNGVGYGIDGYCCEVGDKLKALGKKVDYTAIAIKGLLFHYKPCNATVTVDGNKYHFKKVWIAPTMHGKYYGGGMIPAPEQSREDSEKLSLCILSGKGKIKTLMAFPKIFSGEHVKNKMTTILSGSEITVEFEKPTALQIDGETILGVTCYTARANKQAAESKAA